MTSSLLVRRATQLALLRSIVDTNSHDSVRDLILAAYAEYEKAA